MGVRALSPGAWVLLVAAAISTATVLSRPDPARADLEMWIFAALHADVYRPVVERLNEQHPDRRLNVLLLSKEVMERRMLSGFLSETPVADLIEVERAFVGRAFLGPPDSVGFVDLTDRIEADALLDIINPPSFSPWMNRGRIYGLPHDVHPVMLGYRSDIVEAAGIDVSQIETWDDFERVMAPLMADHDADGRPDRYLLGLWENDAPKIEVLMMQAGGGYFAPDGSLALDRPANARVLARVIDWIAGPGRIADEVPDFSGSGNKLKLDGHAIAYLMPDWMCSIWRVEIPQLEGKVKVMPLPAWEPGGRRTSVWGGTMLGISRTSDDIDGAYETAKALYLDRDVALAWYEIADIVTPVRTYWDDPIFDRPDPYFSGQAKGRMYIEQAPHIPMRVPSPYYKMVEDRMRDAARALAEFARARPGVTRAELEAQASVVLREAEDHVRVWMERNVFVAGADQPEGDAP
jgi:arabinosaccharide transport system substrate-binding protein